MKQKHTFATVACTAKSARQGGMRFRRAVRDKRDVSVALGSENARISPSCSRFAGHIPVADWLLTGNATSGEPQRPTEKHPPIAQADFLGQKKQLGSIKTENEQLTDMLIENEYLTNFYCYRKNLVKWPLLMPTFGWSMLAFFAKTNA